MNSNWGNSSGRSISRILSSGSLRLCNHLSGRRVTAPLGAAYPGLASSTSGKGACGDEQSPVVRGRLRPCLALLPAGVTWPSALRQMPVVSYTTFSPSPEGCLFLWPYPAGSRLSALPRPGCYPTPCPVECGLSSILRMQDRDCPTSLRRIHHTRGACARQRPNSGHFEKRH